MATTAAGTANSVTNEQAAAQARRLVEAFFNDVEKSTLWFQTENVALFGGIKPAELIRMGKADKLLRVIKLQLAENENPPPRGEKRSEK